MRTDTNSFLVNKNSLYSWYLKLTNTDRLEIVSILTLILLILYAPKFWYAHSLIIIFSILGLIFANLRRSAFFWFTVASFLISVNYFNWYDVDNHKYLESYWCFSLFCIYSVPKERRMETLYMNGKLLIGLVMAFSVLAKLISHSYMNGSFFEYTLLIDKRFEFLASTLSDLTLKDLSVNQVLEQLLRFGYLHEINLEVVELISSHSLKKLALFLTWWTLLIEGFLAITFLLPDKKVTSIFRNVSLIVFGITTYSVATVVGFGWLLMILGIAQSSGRSKIFIIPYLLTFLIIQLYTIPFGKIFNIVVCKYILSC